MDSHHTLPTLFQDKESLDSIDIYPFTMLINHGLEGIMNAHLHIPVIDPDENTASTLSRAVVFDLLEQELGFKGFKITDALDMKGVSKYFKAGEIELKALQAGNDILLLPQNLEVAIKCN